MRVHMLCLMHSTKDKACLNYFAFIFVAPIFHFFSKPGSEFYMEEWPGLVGKTFGEISFMFRDAVPIGLRRASENMKVELNPPDGLLFGAGDELVVRARLACVHV